MGVLRMTAVLSGLAVATMGLASCSPTPTFVVDANSGLGDAAPGDGVCEAESPGGCTLEAAIDEGNALGAAEITVPAGTYGVTRTITGNIGINRGAPTAVFLGGSLTVAASASLWIEGVSSSDSLSNFVVSGDLTMVRGVVINFGTALLVHAGGSATVVNSVLYAGGGSPALDNSGTVNAYFASVYGAFTSSAVNTNNVGGVNVGASLLATDGATVCTNGVPTSSGGNLASDTSCAIAATGDVEGVDPQISPVTSVTGRPIYTIASTSPLVDSIGVNVGGCGSLVVADVDGGPRPVDGNGSIPTGCDTGAVERPA